MKHFILKKDILIFSFEKYLQSARETNQFSNYGWAVKELESRARHMLKIDDDKAVLAVSSGASGLNVIVHALERSCKNVLRTITQDFTFPSSCQSTTEGALITDIDLDMNIDLQNDYIGSADIILVTNIFGHVQNIDKILSFAESNNKIVVFDNAASPYSFYKGKNISNYGTASFISLHHTKPIGFGEGGLVIIDKEHEEEARSAICFGWDNEKNFNERGGNYKMSELSAAGILQWWDQFSIDDLQAKYLDNYYNKRYELATEEGFVYKHHGDENFFPSCLPFIHEEPTNNLPEGSAKYYKPLQGFPNSQYVYDRIVCYGLAENWYV